MQVFATFLKNVVYTITNQGVANPLNERMALDTRHFDVPNVPLFI